MRKLSLYINEDQFQKLQILLGEQEQEKIEEFLNETIYDVIISKWIELKGDLIAKLMEEGDFEEETIRFTLNGIDYDIFDGGDSAVISENDGDSFMIKLVDGHLYFFYENGNLVACS